MFLTSPSSGSRREIFEVLKRIEGEMSNTHRLCRPAASKRARRGTTGGVR